MRSIRRLPFVEDNRGVAPVLGFILIWGILMLALAGYQAEIVPQQNAQTEFQHYEDVQNDMIQLRNSISNAGQTDRTQFQSVLLGTEYQTRTVTINPPPPAGTLETSEETYEVRITDEEGKEVTVDTRFLRYDPGYAELRAGEVWYENSVLYIDERGDKDGGFVVEDQKLVTDDGTVRLTILQGEVSEAGISRETLELYTNQSEKTYLTDELTGTLTIELPTRLDDEYWGEVEEEYPDQFESDGGELVDEDGYPDGVYRVNLTTHVDDLELNTVGIGSEPDDDPARLNIPTLDRIDDKEDDEKEWEGCPSPPSPPAEGSDGVRYISEDPSGNINADGDTIVVEDGVDVSANINNPGDVFIGEDASVSSNLGASGDIVFERDATLSGNINDAEDVFLLPGSYISTNVGVEGTVYLISEEDQIGGKINSGEKEECSELSD